MKWKERKLGSPLDLGHRETSQNGGVGGKEEIRRTYLRAEEKSARKSRKRGKFNGKGGWRTERKKKGVSLYHRGVWRGGLVRRSTALGKTIWFLGGKERPFPNLQLILVVQSTEHILWRVLPRKWILLAVTRFTSSLAGRKPEKKKRVKKGKTPWKKK